MDVPAPSLELVARVEVHVAEPLEVGVTPLGRRRVVPIVGGRFEGPRMSGRVLPVGADWQLVLPDGTALIDTRYLLRTDDGCHIVIATRGSRHGPPEVLAALAAGEPVDPASYTFRVSARFEAAEDRYAWLNRAVVVASALRTPDRVIYDAYRVG